MSEILTWYEDWKDKKPVRTAEMQKPLNPGDKQKQPKHFRAMIVWNYTDERLQMLELTQKWIQESLHWLYEDEERGDLRNYDIKIKKDGEGMSTEYSVTTSPKGEVLQEIKKQYDETYSRLENLFEWKDRFEENENFWL